MNDPTVASNTALNFLQFDERAYKYIRQFSIKNLTDAVVELLTNSCDAYTRGNLPYPHVYIIQYFDSNNSFHIIDNAIGLNAEKMAKCFLQVGQFTSSETSRGFFSRGAKDVSILGDVYFESIKDGLYSKCMINSEACGAMLVSDMPVTQDMRNRLNIPGNGLHVTIMVLPTYQCHNIITFKQSIITRASLRRIMADPENIITFQNLDIANDYILNDRIRYIYPEGKIILDLTYNVPNYENVVARWKVFQSDKPIPQPNNENEMEFGFLITSHSDAVHEVSTLDSRFRWNPFMNMLYGTLECNYLVDLLYDMDINGVSDKNPNIVIDPSRFTGLNRDHPFVKSLLSIPLVRIDKMLRDLDVNISKSSVQLDDFNDILDEIEEYGVQIFDNLPQKLEWQQSYDGTLIKSILNDRTKYTVTERNFEYGTAVDPTYKKECNDLVALNNSSIITKLKASVNETTGSMVYAIDDVGNVVGIESDININAIDITTDEIKKFYDDVNSKIDITLFTQHPYIYSLNDNGDLIKLFIFEKGQLGSLTDREQNAVNDTKKVINITFTKDINITYRYVVDMSSGIIEIKINLNNPTVKLYLLNDSLSNNLFDISKLSGLQNNKSYIFLSELFIEIFAKIIVLGKSMNKSIVIVDADTETNINKVYAHHEKIVTAIEKPINNIFENYYDSNAKKMLNELDAFLMEKIQDPILLKELQDNIIGKLNLLF